jgi:hypothetical protein
MASKEDDALTQKGPVKHRPFLFVAFILRTGSDASGKCAAKLCPQFLQRLRWKIA